MDLKKLKALASRTLGVGVSRIKIVDAEKAVEAITRDDVKRLVKEKAIRVEAKKGVSRGRARVRQAKKKTGRRTGTGKRKGTAKTRMQKKQLWMTQVRSQRRKLKALKPKNYRKLYKMVKAGYFRSIKHLESFIKKE